MRIYSIVKDKTDEDTLYNIQLMTEDEKKLHIITQLNTRINRESTDKVEYYVNKSIIYY